MKKRIYSAFRVKNKTIVEPLNKNITEHLVNTGNASLEEYPPTYQFTKDIYAVLMKHKMVDKEDDRVEFSISIDT